MLQNIQSRQQNDHKRKRLMYRQWLELFPEGHWGDVIAALSSIGEEEVAGRVRQEYSLQGEEHQVE